MKHSWSQVWKERREEMKGKKRKVVWITEWEEKELGERRTEAKREIKEQKKKKLEESWWRAEVAEEKKGKGKMKGRKKCRV